MATETFGEDQPQRPSFSRELGEGLHGEEAARHILQMTGEDLSRAGLKDTPRRVAKAYKHLLSGYGMTPKQAIGEGVFPSEGRGLVSVREVEFYSLCEHHLVPFWGTVSVSYFPRDKILGLSKIPRLVDLFCRRIQVQERITEQLSTAIEELIQPRATLVEVKAQHMCMMMRGVEKMGSFTTTQKMTGYDTLNAYEQKQISDFQRS